MSLFEQYQDALREENDRKIAEQKQISIRDYFQGLGLDVFDKRAPFFLPASAKAKINELIPLIKKEKWLETSLYVTTADIIKHDYRDDTIVPSVSNCSNILKMRKQNTPRLLKYQWADGTIHVGELSITHIPSNIYKRRQINKFIEDTNKKFKCLTQHLYGTQKFVILVVKVGTWDDGGDQEDFLALFEDGYLFLLPNSYNYKYSIKIDEQANYHTLFKRIPLDEILVSNLMWINN